MSNPLPLAEITRLLAQEYGNHQWRSHGDPLSELVLTILSQNTSDSNSRRAFASLVARFGTWEAVAGAGVAEISQSIRSGGLAQVKAPRIKLILSQILRERGSLDLSFLSDLPTTEAQAWLRELPGVGPKTAGCVLLFSLGRPVLPVDTHVYRVARRLGLIDHKVSTERAHKLLGSMVPPDDIYQLHLNMVEHGRRVCRAQWPRCRQCVLQAHCPQILEGDFDVRDKSWHC